MIHMDLQARLSDTQQPPLVIAEAADAHYGSLSRAKEMVGAAFEAGADVIKFQHHLPSEEMLREIPLSSNMKEPLWDFLETNALSIDEHVELASFCSSVGITFACTPFSLQAAREIEEGVQPLFYKIGSGEMLDFPTLAEIAAFGRPMFVSTGMSTVEEVDEMYEFLSPLVKDLTLLNCTSAYPTDPSEMHLGFLTEMQVRYPGATIGHSEHSASNHFSLAAVALGARVIERHVTIDASLSGPDAEVSLTFDDLSRFIQEVREVHASLTVPKKIQPGEKETRLWAHRSLVYLEDLPAGHILNGSEFWGKRPGTGIPARQRDLFVGKTLRRDVLHDTLLGRLDFLD